MFSTVSPSASDLTKKEKLQEADAAPAWTPEQTPWLLIECGPHGQQV